ncbi:MAG TPA: acyl carrier protein [Methylophilaceae bacterium]|jgi:acyl carrier protein
MSTTFDTLKQIVIDKFDIEAAKILPEATLESLGLDSLDTFDMIFSAEETFNIKVPNSEVDIKTVEDVVNLIDRLVKEQAPAA